MLWIRKNIKEDTLKAGQQRQPERTKEYKGEDSLIQNEEKYFNSEKKFKDICQQCTQNCLFRLFLNIKIDSKNVERSGYY